MRRAITVVGVTFVMLAAWTDYAKPAVCTTCWEQVAGCESAHRWYINTGNGYYGGLQFDYETWKGVGGQAYARYPHEASRWEQILMAERLRQRRGLDPWPVCGWRYYD